MTERRYCRQCYASLAEATEPHCPKCRRSFSPHDPESYLTRPFPTWGTIVLHVMGTTVLAVVVAFVVAFHQMIRSSGH